MKSRSMHQRNRLNLVAGKDKFERSENLSFPAGPPSASLVPPGGPPAEPTSGGLDPDEVWEDDRPPARQSTDEVAGLADSLSWADAPLPPNLKARRRGTLAPAVERPADAAVAAAEAVAAGHLAAERPAGAGLRRAGGRLEAHALCLEEAVRGTRSGGPDGPAQGGQARAASCRS